MRAARRCLVLPVLAFSAQVFVMSVAVAQALPTFAEVKASYLPSDVRILDRSAEPLHRLRTNANVRRGRWVTIQEVSPAFRAAIVLSEDKRFYEHSGVDWRAVSSAAWANLWNQKTRGASTITMQLVGLLDEDLRHKKSRRDFKQKIEQTISAERLELRWRKDQILEADLNLVPLRGEMVGIDAVSQTLFGKAAQGLDNREAAVTAALVRGPNAKPAEVARRACGVLLLMEPVQEQTPAMSLPQEHVQVQERMEVGVKLEVDVPQPTIVDQPCAGLNLFVDQALQRKAFEPSAGVAPHASKRALGEWRQQQDRQSGVPREIVTTLSGPLQRFAVQTLQSQLRELRNRHVQDGALVVLDNATGVVLAWVGSSGKLSLAEQVDGVLALRQPGSTLKPFLYAQAIAERRLTAASLLNDSGAQLQTGSGLYIPQNYDHKFKGWISARTALASSLNLPAVRTLVMVTPDAFANQLKTLGVPLKETGSYYGYSLALGSAEVSLLDLTNAFRTLANGGCYANTQPLSTPGRAHPCKQVLDPRAAFIVSDIMADPQARAGTFGTDSVLATRFWTAVKTGTSKDMRDNWAVGYSAHYTVGVWVGNANGAAMWDVSGTTGAAPIWATIMGFLHRNRPSQQPAASSGLISQIVDFNDATGAPLEATRSEWFLAGTEQTHFGLPGVDGEQSVTRNTQATAARITSPTTDTILAIDPDIPPQAQRVALRADTLGVSQDLTWVIDGNILAQGGSAQWMPWPGKHLVTLTNANGEPLDSIRLEVRGATAKAP